MSRRIRDAMAIQWRRDCLAADAHSVNARVRAYVRVLLAQHVRACDALLMRALA